MPSFPGVDFLDFDSLLNDEEKLVRQTARQFVDNEILPIIEKHNREATFPMHLVPQLGELGFFGANLHGLRLRRNVQRRLRPGHAGTRARRFRPAQLCLRAKRAGDVSDSFLSAATRKKTKWLPHLQAAKPSAASASPNRNSARIPAACLRAPCDGRALHPERRKNVDHQWFPRRCRRRLGQMRRRKSSRLPGRKRHAGIQSLGRSRQMVAARLRHFRPRHSAIAKFPRKIFCPASTGLRGPLSCLNQARYGIGWGAIGAAMACYDTALQYAKTRKQFAEQAHRLAPTRAGEARLDDHGNQQGATPRAARRPPERSGQSGPHAHLHAENEQRLDGPGYARKARDILGANGIVDDYCVMRHMNNLECVYTYEGTQRHSPTDHRRKNHRHFRVRLNL